MLFIITFLPLSVYVGYAHDATHEHRATPAYNV
jgi:hypothetical protein